MLFCLYLGIPISSCLFSITNPIIIWCTKQKLYHAFGDAYTISSQLSNPLSAKQVLFLPHALKETAYPSYGFQEHSHNISDMCTIIVTSLSVSLSWEQLYFSCISCAVIRPQSPNVADATWESSENPVPAKAHSFHCSTRAFEKAAGEEELHLVKPSMPCKENTRGSWVNVLGLYTCLFIWQLKAWHRGVQGPFPRGLGPGSLQGSLQQTEHSTPWGDGRGSPSWVKTDVKGVWKPLASFQTTPSNQGSKPYSRKEKLAGINGFIFYTGTFNERWFSHEP